MTTKRPAWIDMLAATLPSHAHVIAADSSRNWGATWTTPGGTWGIEYRDPSLSVNTLLVTGPRMALTVEYPHHGHAEIALHALKALGALPGLHVGDNREA